MSISVIIPTYARLDVLGSALSAWREQTRLPEQLIVVDDGSPRDGARAVVESVLRDAPFEVTFLRQDNAGPAVARNAGVAAATGDLIFFAGDDIVPTGGLLAAHLAHHDRGIPRLAVLGLTEWAPFAETTPFMRWIDEGCVLPQFGYKSLAADAEVDWEHFYTSNVSLPRALLDEAGGFDPRFRYAYGEDGELACRLAELGMRLIYAPDAIAYHVHRTTPRMLARRAWVAGAVAQLLPCAGPTPSYRVSAAGRVRRAASRVAVATTVAALTVWDAARLPVSPAVGGVMNWCLRRRTAQGLEETCVGR